MTISDDAFFAAKNGALAPHHWQRSTYGHGTLMCTHCKATDAELAVMNELNHCKAAPAVAPPAHDLEAKNTVHAVALAVRRSII